MEKIMADTKMIARCGLYCGACRKHLKGKCPGCSENEKASWCKLRICTIEKNIASCAECDEYNNVMKCEKYNNFMAKVFGFVFNSDRSACINRIKIIGYEGFAKEMTEKKIVSIKRK